MQAVSIKVLHRAAMEHADLAYEAKRHGDDVIAHQHFCNAFVLEKQAAEMANAIPNSEPSRSILFRSAATLGIQAEQFQEAAELVCRALEGAPPTELIQELEDIGKQLTTLGFPVSPEFGSMKTPVIAESDAQIKVRGFQIELGEIEAALIQHPDINNAVVLARDEIPGSKRLVAYIVPVEQQVITSQIREWLSQRLPEYMIPSSFVQLKGFPLTASGKLDRKALQIEPRLLTAVDIGSAKTCVLVAEVSEFGLHYRGHGIAESRGLRKGAITDLDKAARSIQKAVEEAERLGLCPLGNAVISVGGAHIRGIRSRGGVTLGSRPREVGGDDIRAAIEKARSILLGPDREVLHLFPQEFVLDDEAGIRDPIGMVGTRLEVTLYVVTAASSAIQNVVTAVNRAGIHVDDVVYSGLVAADSTLRPAEREMGVCLVDIGAGCAESIVYWKGLVLHSEAVPIGGDHFTNDVSVGLRTPLIDAERLKISFGTAVADNVPEDNEIEVPGVGDRPSRFMPRRFLAEVLESRAVEFCEMLRDHLDHASVLKYCNSGLVLTGGGSRLKGIAEICERILDCPVRLASPSPLGIMPAELAEPEFATIVGSVLYGSAHLYPASGGSLISALRSHGGVRQK